jgi:hypothetical protein
MAGASGLALVLLGGLVGVPLVAAALGLLLYGHLATNARGALRASVAALCISLVASLLSFPFWKVVLSGRDTHGDPLVYRESWPLVGVVVLEALTVAAAAWGVVRQRRRLRTGARGGPEEKGVRRGGPEG